MNAQTHTMATQEGKHTGTVLTPALDLRPQGPDPGGQAVQGHTCSDNTGTAPGGGHQAAGSCRCGGNILGPGCRAPKATSTSSLTGGRRGQGSHQRGSNDPPPPPPEAGAWKAVEGMGSREVTLRTRCGSGRPLSDVMWSPDRSRSAAPNAAGKSLSPHRQAPEWTAQAPKNSLG